MRRRLVVSLMMAVGLSAIAPEQADAQGRRAFRATKLAFRDPHVYVDALGTGACSNITNPPGLLGISINKILSDFVTTCQPVTPGVAEPCTYDLNLVAILDPAIQTPGEGGALAPCLDGNVPCAASVSLFDSCTRSGGSIHCEGDTSATVETTYSNAGAGLTCLDPFPGTFGANNRTPYSPAIVPAAGPCLISGPVDFTFRFGSTFVIPIPLRGLQMAAQYVGDPATGLIKGIVRGFLPESAADVTSIEVTDPVPISIRLAEALPGGADKCYGGERDGQPCSKPQSFDPSQCPGGECRLSCAPAGQVNDNNKQDDRDRNPPDSPTGERGWWIYLEFEASAVTVPVPPTPTPTATATNTPLPTETPTPTLTPTATPRPQCAGDCNGDFNVSIGEVQTAANIFLEAMPLASCTRADSDGDGKVFVNEIVRAARSFSRGCP